MGLISTLGTIAGGLLQTKATKEANRQSQQFAINRYNVERQDNLDFWRQQNEYNSAVNQKKRLQEAGLNPALLYGGSATGAAGTAGPLNTPDTQSAQFRVPDKTFIGNSIGDYFDTKIKQAQYSNLLTQNTVNLEEAALKQSTRTGKDIDNRLEAELYQVNADARALNLQQLRQNYGKGVERHGQDMLESGTRVQLNHLKADTQRIIKQNLKKDGELKDYELNLRSQGLNQSDEIYWRLLTQWLTKRNKLKK